MADSKVAIVTGGSAGIGRAIAKRLLQGGYEVTVCARNEKRLSEASEELASHGHVHAVQGDVTDDDDVRRLVSSTVEKFGPVDIVVNNAAIVGDPTSSFQELSIDDWQNVIDVNLYGVVRVIQEVLPSMRDREHGRIINVASASGIRPDPAKPHYSASKAAIINLTKALAKGYSDEGILVNAVTPSVTRTPMVEDIFEEYGEKHGITTEEAERKYITEKRSDLVLQRAADPEEVANVVHFLASDESSFVTGANYRVEGGAIPTMDT